jgi:hypothetical protein
MRVFPRARELWVVAAALSGLFTVGVEARAQQQIDVQNRSFRPMLFQVAIPSPQNPLQPLYLTEQMTLYPGEVGHWQVPAGVLVQSFTASDGSTYYIFGYQAYDPWTNAFLMGGGSLFGSTGMQCTTYQFPAWGGQSVSVLQTFVP